MIAPRAAMVALLLLGACRGEKRSQAAAEPEPTADPAAPAAEDAGPPPVAEPPSPPTAEQRAALAAHLRRGRRLLAGGEVERAIAELDAALAIDPHDARVLSERALAALRQSDFATARETSERAIDDAVEPGLLAAAHYNRGRALEGLEQPARALEAYQQSLRLRPTGAARERVVALGGDTAVAAPAPPCPGPRPRADLCACLGPAEPGDCSIEIHGATGSLRHRSRAGDDHVERLYLLTADGDDSAIVTELTAATGSEVGTDLADLATERRGGRTILRLDTTATSSRERDGATERRFEHAASYCVRRGNGPLRCPLRVPIERRWELTDGARTIERWRHELQLRLDAGGTLHVSERAREGEPDERASTYLGDHRLW